MKKRVLPLLLALLMVLAIVPGTVFAMESDGATDDAEAAETAETAVPVTMAIAETAEEDKTPGDADTEEPEPDVPVVKNGLYKDDDGVMRYYKDNQVDMAATGIARLADKSSNAWYYIENGVYKDATGIARKADGSSGAWYFVQNGQYVSTATGIAQKADGSTKAWYFVQNGKYISTATGIARKADGSSGAWYFVKNGKYISTATGIAQKADGSSKAWYFVQNGKYISTATGIAQKADGSSKAWYFVKNGKYISTATGIAQKADGSSKAWYFVQNGKYISTATGIARKADGSSGAWYFVKNGKYVSTGKGIAKKADGSSNAWYYVQNGKYVSTATGVAQKADGSSKIWYYVKNGKYDKTSRCGITTDGSDWNVINGKATKVTTAEQRTLFRALKLLPKIINDKMTKDQELKACFDYVKKTYTETNPRIPHYQGMDWPVIYANDMFVNGKGNCFSYAASFAYLAKAIGYENVYCCHSGGHGWAEINGLVYDPEWSLHNFQYTYYGMDYNKVKVPNYKAAIAAGEPWMHVKI